MSVNKIAVEISHLSKSFDGVEVLSDVDLRLDTGTAPSEKHAHN